MPKTTRIAVYSNENNTKTLTTSKEPSNLHRPQTTSTGRQKWHTGNASLRRTVLYSREIRHTSGMPVRCYGLLNFFHYIDGRMLLIFLLLICLCLCLPLFLRIDIINFKFNFMFNIKLYVIFSNMHRRLTIILYAHLIWFFEHAIFKKSSKLCFPY
jgi:hypothetical protein